MSHHSVHFSAFTSAASLRASDISAVPSLSLQQYPRGGTLKKNNEFTLQKYCWGNSGKENQTGH